MGKYNYEAIKDIDFIEYLQKHGYVLKRCGVVYKMSCPLGSDTDPSWVVDPRTMKFSCWHCGGDWRGDIVDFVMGVEHVNKDEAMEILAGEYPQLLNPFSANPEASYSREQRALHSLWKLHERDQETYELEMFRDAEARNAIKASRNLSDDTLRQHGIGITNWGRFPRISFPNRDAKGHVLSFTTRTLISGDTLPSYMAKNLYIKAKDASPFYERVDEDKRDDETIVAYEKHAHLYNVHEAVANEGTIYIVEGHFDVAAMTELGFPSAVAIGTSRLSDAQCIQLKELLEERGARDKKKVYDLPIVFVPDNDKTGERDLLLNYLMLRKHFPDTILGIVSVKRCPLPFAKKKDVGDLCSQARTAEERASVVDFLGVYRFFEEVFCIRHDPKQNAMEFVSKAKALLQSMTEPFGRAIYIKYLASVVGADATILASCMNREVCNDGNAE